MQLKYYKQELQLQFQKLADDCEEWVKSYLEIGGATKISELKDNDLKMSAINADIQAKNWRHIMEHYSYPEGGEPAILTREEAVEFGFIQCTIK